MVVAPRAPFGSGTVDLRAAAVLVGRMNIATTRGTTSRAMSLPNLLTYGRIAAIPVVVGCIYAQSILDQPLWLRWVAVAIFIAAGVTDYLDGYYARIWNQQSAFGRMLEDRKSTRLNSSHVRISYAVFCLKKKNKLHYHTNALLAVS